MYTYEEDSAPLFIAKETQKIWKPLLDSFPIQKRILKSGRIRLSIGRPVDRPKSRSTERSTAPTREQSLVSRSTVRSTVLLLRSTVIAYARWCTPVNRHGRSLTVVGHILSSSLALIVADRCHTSLFLQKEF